MKVLSRVPFSQSPSVVSTPDGIAEVKPFQIVLMVSLAPRGLTELPKESARFPAILDTGQTTTSRYARNTTNGGRRFSFVNAGASGSKVASCRSWLAACGFIGIDRGRGTPWKGEQSNWKCLRG
jgi:hypothetical protein